MFPRRTCRLGCAVLGSELTASSIVCVEGFIRGRGCHQLFALVRAWLLRCQLPAATALGQPHVMHCCYRTCLRPGWWPDSLPGSNDNAVASATGSAACVEEKCSLCSWWGSTSLGTRWLSGKELAFPVSSGGLHGGFPSPRGSPVAELRKGLSPS